MASQGIPRTQFSPQIGYASPSSSPTGSESDSPRSCSSELSSFSVPRTPSPDLGPMQTFTGRSNHPLERFSRVGGGGCLDASS